MARFALRSNVVKHNHDSCIKSQSYRSYIQCHRCKNAVPWAARYCYERRCQGLSDKYRARYVCQIRRCQSLLTSSVPTSIPGSLIRSVVQSLINDVHTSTTGDAPCKLQREGRLPASSRVDVLTIYQDAGLALSALKNLGRNPNASSVISISEVQLPLRVYVKNWLNTP